MREIHFHNLKKDSNLFIFRWKCISFGSVSALSPFEICWRWISSLWFCRFNVTWGLLFWSSFISRTFPAACSPTAPPVHRQQHGPHRLLLWVFGWINSHWAWPWSDSMRAQCVSGLTFLFTLWLKHGVRVRQDLIVLSDVTKSNRFSLLLDFVRFVLFAI